MSEKTCGNCGRVNGKFCLCLTDMMTTGCHVCLRPETNEACPKWIERTDSLEQVALDVLESLKGCSFVTSADCSGCGYFDPSANYGERCGHPAEYADRLRALGVEVPQ